jgi:hypothetical protein
MTHDYLSFLKGLIRALEATTSHLVDGQKLSDLAGDVEDPAEYKVVPSRTSNGQ